MQKANAIVKNGGQLIGGYGEKELKSYEAVANVTANTNGLKKVTKAEDGSFVIGARQNGTESGIKDAELKVADGITATVKPGNGSYGEFLRVDLTGNYGDLGAHMQSVEWAYYGNDSTYTNRLANYGTKFAADNWMHKMMGIQLGLTESGRCKLPEGTDGTGYWILTVHALGYQDYVVKFQATAENIAKPAGDADSTPLENIIAEAKALNEADYTPESWAAAKDSIAAVASACPDMLVGAGTVINLEQCKAAVSAGAGFIVSPGFDEEIIKILHQSRYYCNPRLCRSIRNHVCCKIRTFCCKVLSSECIRRTYCLKVAFCTFSRSKVSCLPVVLTAITLVTTLRHPLSTQ